MSLYPFPALLSLFPDTVFIIKGNAINGRNPPSCPFPVHMTPFSDITFINKETINAIKVINRCYQ